MKLYTTPPSILTLVTWVPQSKLAFGQTPHVGWPSGLRPSAKPNPTVCSLACRWRLRSALRADQEAFSIETHPLSLIVRPYAGSSELSYSESILTFVTWIPQSKLAFGQTLHVGWPSGLRPSAKPNPTVYSLPCRYDRPCGPIKSLF